MSVRSRDGLRRLLLAQHLAPAVALTALPAARLTRLPGTAPLRALSPRAVRAVGLAQLAGVAGLLAPRRQVRGAAAVGFAAVQLGALTLHLEHGPRAVAPANVGLLVAAVLLAREELA